MGWIKARTTEMPALHRRHGRDSRRRRVVGALVGLGLVGVLVLAFSYSPSLMTWLRQDSPQVGSTSPGAAGIAGGLSTVDTLPIAPPTSTRAPGARTTPTRAPTTSTPTATPMPAVEQAVLRLTNAARAANHCAAMRMEPHLLAAARLHSADMAQNNYFSHGDPAARLQAAGYDTSSGWAENIALGYPTAEAVMAGWLASPGHRANIVNCRLVSIGVGIARSADGRLYWTQDFGGV